MTHYQGPWAAVAQLALRLYSIVRTATPHCEVDLVGSPSEGSLSGLLVDSDVLRLEPARAQRKRLASQWYYIIKC
jgi:hypothetical protein